MSPNLRMRIGSETKTFTGTALLQLVDLGTDRRVAAGRSSEDLIAASRTVAGGAGLNSPANARAAIAASSGNPNRQS